MPLPRSERSSEVVQRVYCSRNLRWFLDLRPARSAAAPSKCKIVAFAYRELTAGGDHVVLKNDAEAIEREMGGVSESTRAKILGLNAARFFKFDIPARYLGS